MPTFQGISGYDDEATIILNSVDLGNCSQPQGLNPIGQNYNWRASQGYIASQNNNSLIVKARAKPFVDTGLGFLLR